VSFLVVTVTACLLNLWFPCPSNDLVLADDVLVTLFVCFLFPPAGQILKLVAHLISLFAVHVFVWS